MPIEQFVASLADPQLEVPTSDFIDASDLSPSELGPESFVEKLAP